MKTVNDFIIGYCDALKHVDMLGSREVVDISSDEDTMKQETDENSFLSAVLDWANVQVKNKYLLTYLNFIAGSRCSAS